MSGDCSLSYSSEDDYQVSVRYCHYKSLQRDEKKEPEDP